MTDPGPTHETPLAWEPGPPSGAGAALRRYHARVFAIARSEAVRSGDVPRAFESLTRFCCEAFKVKRAGVWIASASGDEFLCERVYDGASGLFESGDVLTRAGHDAYFRALEGAQLLTVRDAAADPRTSAFSDYLRTHGIVSMLDAVVHHGHRTAGTISLEHAGVLREWRAEEEILALAVADVAATVLAAHDRRRATVQATLDESRFHDLFENANDMIYTMDLTGHLTSANRVAARRLGFTIEEALGRPFSDFVAPESMGLAVESFRALIAGSRDAKPLELDFVSRDGTRIPVEISTRLAERHGRPVEVQGIGREVTARRAREAQSRHAQKMEALGRLAGGVAHDFNNLLTAISGYAEQAVERTDLDAQLADDLREILSASRRATSLTRQLLAFTRRQDVRLDVLDVNAAIARMETLLRRVIGEDVLLVVSLDPAAGFVCVDAGQFEQIVVNLAVNAREAMPGGGRLEIRTSVLEGAIVRQEDGAAEATGPRVVISVSDTGQGIDEATRMRMFEPFFTTKAFGTGLGLATVLAVVKEMKGDISVESKRGSGSTLTVTLPRWTGPDPAKEAIPDVLPAGGSERILLIEDDDAVRALARRILARKGYAVIDARSAAEALRMVRASAERLHLVITDVVLPGMSAREFTERLAHLHPECKVSYMSGYAPGDLPVVSNGRASFLQKPFSQDGLLRHVREVLDEGGPGEAPVSTQPAAR